MVYLYNMRKSLEMVKKPGLSGGAPVAPVNRLCMRTTPLTAEFKKIPCANPEFVYGFAMLDLSRQPVIVQVPSIDNRFWLIQLGDHRTESFGSLGVQHQTKPGSMRLSVPTARRSTNECEWSVSISNKSCLRDSENSY